MARRAKRAREVFIACLMIAFGLFLAWRCLFDPTFLPDVQPPVRYRDMSLSAFMRLSSTDLNTASREELMELPGIGEVLSDRIIVYRQQQGGFSSVEELTQIRGIGKKTLDSLRKYVYVE